MTVRLLDAELLDEFGALLRSKGVRVDDLEPGLNDAEIDAIVAPTALELPDEVRAWWRWHNGEPPRTYIPILPFREPLDLQYEVESYLDRVETVRARPSGRWR